MWVLRRSSPNSGRPPSAIPPRFTIWRLRYTPAQPLVLSGLIRWLNACFVSGMTVLLTLSRHARAAFNAALALP